MDTPNTRARRKRELNESTSSQEEGGSVIWSHDQRLRRMVLEATSNDVPAPPSPTQKPRSISSLLASASRNGPSGSSTSRPRKRPCRAHRSLPNNLKTTPQTSGTGSSSLPAASAATQESIKEAQHRLDALLGEAMAKFAIIPQTKPRGSATTKTTSSRPVSARDHVSSSHNVAIPKSRIPAPLIAPSHAHVSSRSSSAKESSASSSSAPANVLNTSRSPLSPIKNGAPRVGIPQKSRSSASGPVNMSKQFKSPLMTAALPTRSSPRRAPTFSSLSTPARASPLRSSAQAHSTRTPTVLIRETPARAAKTNSGLLHNANIDVGEDDPEGDRSFDSFDGIFQEGGADIEALFKTVDGSQ